MQQASEFRGKRVVILGLARQGSALARFMVRQGAQVVISDSAPAEALQDELAALGALDLDLVLGGHPLSLLDDCDLLCLSGGVPPQIGIVQTAISRGIPLSNDSLLTFQVARRLGLGPLIAITGSSGKTTTTRLVDRMLAASGKGVHVGGNIGTPLIDRLDTIPPGDFLVLELSSFQLELFDPALAWGNLDGTGPDVAVVLNITPNHLDRHNDMATYAAAKINLLRTLPVGANVVLSADDPITSRIAADEGLAVAGVLPAEWRMNDVLTSARAIIAARSLKKTLFSRTQSLTAGAWLDGDVLFYEGQAICRRNEIKLCGDHNVSNILAAAAASGRIPFGQGATLAGMCTVATTFVGVPHRLEVVAEADNVTWVNDSIATAPERSVAALRSFPAGEQTLVLLAGGKDKNLPWDLFAEETIQRVNFLIGFGRAGAMIVETVQERARYAKKQAPNCAVVQRLDEAVELAARVASRRQAQTAGATQPPRTVVLLSPGGTSYDAYKDFEARGEHFRQLVGRWITQYEMVV